MRVPTGGCFAIRADAYKRDHFDQMQKVPAGFEAYRDLVFSGSPCATLLRKFAENILEIRQLTAKGYSQKCYIFGSSHAWSLLSTGMSFSTHT